jgi:hypothetical protein
MENVQKEIAGARENGKTTGRERAATHLYKGALHRHTPEGSQRGRAVVEDKNEQKARSWRVGGEAFAEWRDETVMTLQRPAGRHEPDAT